MRVNFLYNNGATGQAIVTGFDLDKPSQATREELLGILYRNQVSDQAKVLVAFALLRLQSPELEVVDGGCYALAVDIHGTKFGVTMTAKIDMKTFVELAHETTGAPKSVIRKYINS